MTSTVQAVPQSRRHFVKQVTAAAAGLALLSNRMRADSAPTPPRRLGIALCGLGYYATHLLLPAIKRSRYWQVSGVVTGDRSKGERWAKDCGFSSDNVFSYDTMGQMAHRADIDAVYVVTPNALHAPHTIAAANAGKHVICEKPMAVSVAECDAMIGTCRRNSVRLMIGYRLHYEPHNAELARYGREKTFGGFKKMEGENGFDVGQVAEPKNWRLNPKLSGGGAIMDMGVYVIQAVCMARGEEPPASVTAKFGPVTRPQVFSQIDQSIGWTMDYADGSSGNCRATYAANVSQFRAEGPGGWAELRYPAFYYDDSVLVTSRGKPELRFGNQQLAQMDGMAQEILSGEPSLAPGEMGRRDLTVVEAVLEAARTGKRVFVRGRDGFDPGRIIPSVVEAGGPARIPGVI